MRILNLLFARKFNRVEFYSCAWLMWLFAQGALSPIGFLALIGTAIFASALGEAALRGEAA